MLNQVRPQFHQPLLDSKLKSSDCFDVELSDDELEFVCGGENYKGLRASLKSLADLYGEVDESLIRTV